MSSVTGPISLLGLFTVAISQRRPLDPTQRWKAGLLVFGGLNAFATLVVVYKVKFVVFNEL